jgi:hypothetical protein
MTIKNKKYTPMKVILKIMRGINPMTKNKDICLIIELLSSLCVINENSKLFIKDKIIEEIVQKLIPVIKGERDILSRKIFLNSFIKLLASFSSNEEGIKAVVLLKDIFELVLFCIEHLTPPATNEDDIIWKIFTNSMLFLGNCSQYKRNKIYVILNPSILTILDWEDYPIKIKAFAAQALWLTLNIHQGVIAEQNKKIFNAISDLKVNSNNAQLEEQLKLVSLKFRLV